MSPRTGRPKSDNPKNIIIRIRIDEKTNDSLKAYCQKHNVKITDVVREGINRVLKEK